MKFGASGETYAWIAKTVVRRRWLVLSLIAVIMVIGGVITPFVTVSTSRFGMVSSDNEHQARLERFFERFGYPDMPVILIRGGDDERRRAIVDRMERELKTIPSLEGRVLARMDPGTIAEVLFTRDPAAFDQLEQLLPPGAELASVVEQGLPGMMGALAGQLEAGLEGEGDAGARTQEETDEGLRQLGAMARVLETRLRGGDAQRALIDLVMKDSIPPQKGVDEYGYFTGWDEPHHLIALFPDLPSGEVQDVAPFIAEIRGAIQTVRDEQGLPDGELEIMVTGLPVFATDELDLVTQGIIESGVVTGLAIFLLQLLAFRSLRVALFVQLPLLFGIITTVGFVGVTYGRLTIITSSFIAILLGLGIDFSIHLVTRANEVRRETDCDASTGIIEGMRLAGPGVAAGAVTTVIAFLTTTTTEFTAFAELGLITAFGLVAMMVAAFTIVPALMGMGWGGAKYREAKIPGVHLLTGFVRRVPRLLVVLGVVGAVVGALMLPSIGFNPRYFDFLPKNSKASVALDTLERDGAMSPTFACVSAETFEQGRERAEALRALPTIADVQTVTDILSPLDEERLGKLRAGIKTLGRVPNFQTLRERERSAAAFAKSVDGVVGLLDEIQFELKTNGRPNEAVTKARADFVALAEAARALPEDGAAELADIELQVANILERAWKTGAAVAARGEYAPEDLPPIFRERFLARDGSGAIALFVFPSENIWDLEHARAFSTELRTVDPDATGLAVTLLEHNDMITDGFERAALIAFVVIFLFMIWEFKARLDLALLAIIPVTLGWCWMIGLMIPVGLEFNVVSIVVMPLVIGIGMDAGVHVVHRYQQSAEHNDGVAKLSDMLEGTGAAVLLSSVTTIVAFGGLTIPDYGGMNSLGSVMMLGVSGCLVSSIVVLPALLVALKRAR